MAENHSDLFRKSTLDRISSPDQLNEYIKVTNPSLISILLGIFVILAAGAYWIFSSAIPNSVDLNGIAVSAIGEEQKVYCYVPIATAKRLEEGMDVQISPDYAPRENYGYIKGKVEKIGNEIITSNDITNKFSNSALFAPLLSSTQSANLVEIVLSMGEWSNEAGKSLTVTEGSICQVSAIIGQTRPWELMLNNKK